MEDKWKELLKYIAENSFMESAFLSPTPQVNIEVIGLLDKIAELRGISCEENGKDFNNISDNLEVEEDLLDENTGMVDWRETQF